MAPLKPLARAQIELAGLASRRAQAYVEIPSRLARCRTPMDLVRVQAQFWQTACDQYAQSSRHLAETWIQAFIPPLGTPTVPPSHTGDTRPSHDYMAVTPPAAKKNVDGTDRRRAELHAV